MLVVSRKQDSGGGGGGGPYPHGLWLPGTRTKRVVLLATGSI